MRRTVLLLATGIAAAAPASAGAATLGIAPAKPCYRTGEAVTLGGSGFTPGVSASVALDGDFLGSLTADGAGNIGSSLTFGRFEGVKQRTLTATDNANAANVGSTSFLAAAVTVRVRPSRGTPGRILRVRSTGFTTGRRLWAHILRRGFKRDVRVGRLKGPCRRGNTRRRIFNYDAKPATYTVQFDTKRRYSRRTKVRVRFRVRVYRTLGSSAAAATGAWRLID